MKQRSHSTTAPKVRLVLPALAPLLLIASVSATPGPEPAAVHSATATSHSATPGAERSPAQSRALPPWQSLSFKATKLMITARSTLTAHQEPIAEARAHWAELEAGGRQLENHTASTIQLSSETSVLGRTSVTNVWVEPESLAAFQRTLVESGSRNRKKVYRFGDGHAVALRSEPANPAERELPEPQWTRRGTERIEVPAGTIVTDPLALFYLIATHPVAELDLGIEVDVLTSNRVNTVRIKRTTETGTTRTKSTVSQADGTPFREEQSIELPVRIYEVSPVANASDLRLLGLEGAIQVVVDETLRMPLEIRGKIPPVGSVTVRLVSATLR